MSIDRNKDGSPRRIGRWTVKRRLNQGGNAEVWLGVDESGQEAAIKCPRRARGVSLRRFTYEIEALKRFSKEPGVIPVVDYEVSEAGEDSYAWLAMPRATEIPGSLSLEEVARGMADVAETLANLHAADFAHRDLKPQNLMIYNGRWVLIDLGLVSYPEKPEETPPDGKLGPAHFLAPEMLTTAGTADGKPADVYLLAKTLWVLATGQRYPWAGEQPASNANCRLENWVAHPRALLLNDLLDRATRHQPSERPTAKQFGQELRTWLEPPTAVALPANEFPDRSQLLASLSSPARQEQLRLRNLMHDLDVLHASVWERVGPYTIKALASTGFEAVQTTGHELVRCLEARTLGYGKPARSASVALRVASPSGASLETGVCAFFYPTKHPELGELFRVGAGHMTRVPIMTLAPGFNPNILTLAQGRCNTAEVENQVNQLVSDYVNSLNTALDEFEKAVRKLSGHRLP